MEYLRAIWWGHVIPILYLVTMWGLATVGIGLFLGDLLTGAGVVSSAVLLYVTRQEFLKEMFLRTVENDIQEQA